MDQRIGSVSSRGEGARAQPAGGAATTTALVLACAALAIGVPGGVLLGRAAWQVSAGQLGILPVVTVPWGR
jgi:hypothetical protein